MKPASVMFELPPDPPLPAAPPAPPPPLPPVLDPLAVPPLPPAPVVAVLVVVVVVLLDVEGPLVVLDVVLPVLVVPVVPVVVVPEVTVKEPPSRCEKALGESSSASAQPANTTEQSPMTKRTFMAHLSGAPHVQVSARIVIYLERLEYPDALAQS
jgi:hypothetical protein